MPLPAARRAWLYTYESQPRNYRGRVGRTPEFIQVLSAWKRSRTSCRKRACRMRKMFVDLQEILKYPGENIGANWCNGSPFAIYKYPCGKLKRSQFICDWEMETKSSLVYKHDGFHSLAIYSLLQQCGLHRWNNAAAIIGKLSSSGFMHLWRV